MVNCADYPAPLRNLRHQTVSASRNHGLAAAMNSSGEGVVLGSRWARAITKTSQVVRLVRAKTQLVIWCGIMLLRLRVARAGTNGMLAFQSAVGSTQPKMFERFDSGRSRLDTSEISVEMGCNVVRN